MPSCCNVDTGADFQDFGRNVVRIDRGREERVPRHGTFYLFVAVVFALANFRATAQGTGGASPAEFVFIALSLLAHAGRRQKRIRHGGKIGRTRLFFVRVIRYQSEYHKLKALVCPLIWRLLCCLRTGTDREGGETGGERSSQTAEALSGELAAITVAVAVWLMTVRPSFSTSSGSNWTPVCAARHHFVGLDLASAGATQHPRRNSIRSTRHPATRTYNTPL